MRALLPVAALAFLACPAQTTQTSTSALSSLRLEPLAAGDETCPAGGVRLVTSDGDARSVCNGTSATASGLTLTPLAVGDAHCPAGGTKLEGALGASYACNGAAGMNGALPVLTALPVGDASCPTGGTKFQLGDVVSYACSGAKGADGAAAEPVLATTLMPGDATCPAGGTRLSVGSSSTVVCHGTPGRDGQNGQNGQNGVDGRDGLSVGLTTLAVGSADCRFGGVRLSVGLASSVVCNATMPAQGLGADTVELATPGFLAAPIPLTRASVGLSTEFIESRVVSPQGATLIRFIPGRVTPVAAQLELPLAASLPLWQWRADVLNGRTWRRQATLTFRRAGAVIGSYELTDAWPSEFRHLEARSGARAVEVTLAFSVITALTTQAGTSPLREDWTVTSSVLGAPTALRSVSGAESSSEVVSTTRGDGGTIYVPGPPSPPKLEVSRVLRGDATLWSWYERARTNVSAARADLSLSATSGETMTLYRALPFSWSASLGDDGLARETMFLGAEASTRSQ
ncbi:MAG: hypothetical protein ACOZQL_04140 [Myxococcota bacterium]